MSNYCQNCGQALADGARFCPNCGQDQQSPGPADTPVRTSNGKRLHCPECRSTAISPVVETEINGGTSLNHSFSRKNSVSTMRFNSTHRNYWMCSNCGRKFRNLQNLEEELASQEKLAKNGIIGMIIVALLGIFEWIAIGFGISLLAWLVEIICIVCYFILKSRINKLREERIYLKRNCFG